MLGAVSSACCCAANALSCCSRIPCSGGGGDNSEGDDQSSGPSNWVRLKYASLLMIGYLLCLSVKDGVHALITHFPFLKLTGCEDALVKDLCYGHTYVYRICFALFVFYLVHFLCSLDCGAACCSGSAQQRLQRDYFCIKASLLGALLLFTLFVGPSFFNGFAHLCVVGGGVFILMQILIILDFSYEWNDSWSVKSEEDQRYGYLLLLCTLVFYALGFTMVGLMYHWFTTGDSGCTLNSALITITLVTGLLYSLAALRLEHASLLPASMIFLYCTVVCFSAIQSGSDSNECNALWTPTLDRGLSATVVISSAVAIFTLVYSCISASNSSNAFTLVAQDEEAQEDPDQPASYALFHFVMVVATMYMAMLLTSWSTNGEEAVSTNTKAALWVKIIAQWATILTYCWTLVAPLILTDREF